MRPKIQAPADEPLTMRILISYWYFQNEDVGAMIRRLQELSGIKKLDVFADSGAFTAQSSGVYIDLKEYTDWIHKWEEYLTCYLNLDVIGDQAGTSRNQELLEKKYGVHPIPVFTFQRHGCDYSILERMIDRYEYIALGGMVPFMGRPRAIMPHIIRCFKLAGDRAVFHGLGCTSWTILKHVPFYSVDSSSWVGGVRYGNLAVFNEKSGTWIRTQLGNPRSFKGSHGLFARYGYNANDFMHRATQQYHDVAALQALSYMAAERWLRRRHGLIFLPSEHDGVVKDCIAIDPRHPEAIEQAGGRVFRLDNELQDRNEGPRSYLATTPPINGPLYHVGERVGEVNDAGGKIYLANILLSLYDEAAQHLGVIQPPGTKVYLADAGGWENRFPPAAEKSAGLNRGQTISCQHYQPRLLQCGC